MAESVQLVVHGHFYQPPRENPWTEEVAREPSAAPFHDWNRRIVAECYRPNTFARIVDDRHRVVGIVDNYRRLSFDFGPTLLSWAERHEPETYRRMVAGDRARAGGLAQAFGHLILPLCNQRDLRTQLRWGAADFAHRFGRRPEGMWLPEAAVNDDVLRALAVEGIRFTVLSPRQATRVRPLAPSDPRENRLDIEGATGWTPVDESTIDTSRTYRWCDPRGSGAGIDIVFYNGGISHDIAFGLGGMSSEALIERVVAAAPAGGLVVLATDGETFGHHHRFGDRVLAYALAVEAPRRGVVVTTLADVLRRHPPVDEVEIRESSWSCVHGVGRWREDCGCSTGGQPGWNQRWRAPLRDALELLRDHTAEVFERRGAGLFDGDPWAARDAYIEVLLGVASPDQFAATYIAGDRADAFSLLEAQRGTMAMFTSCGWFFDDLAGLETVQILRYAARVMDHLADIGEAGVEDRFLAVLAKAESNRSDQGDGRRVWASAVEPARVDPFRTVAHLALAQLLEQAIPERIGAYNVELLAGRYAARGPVALCSGQVRLTHRRTGRQSSRVYAAVRLGRLEVFGANRRADPRRDEAIAEILWDAFHKGAPLTTLIRLVTPGFGTLEFGLTSALPDGAADILHSTAAAVGDRFATVIDRVFDDHRATFETLAALGEPMPAELRVPVELALAHRLEAAVAAAAAVGPPDPRRYAEAVAIASSARAAGFELVTPGAAATIERLLLETVRAAVASGTAEAIDTALGVVALADALDLHPDVQRAQELLFDALAPPSALDPVPGLAGLGSAVGLAVDRLTRF